MVNGRGKTRPKLIRIFLLIVVEQQKGRHKKIVGTYTKVIFGIRF